MNYRFVPAASGGNGKTTTTKSGYEMEGISTPQANIISTPAGNKVLPSQQITPEGEILENKEGLKIYNNNKSK